MGEVSFATISLVVNMTFHMKEMIFSFHLKPFGSNSIDWNSYLRAEKIKKIAHSYNRHKAKFAIAIAISIII